MAFIVFLTPSLIHPSNCALACAHRTAFPCARLALSDQLNEETCWNAHKFSNQSTGEPSIATEIGYLRSCNQTVHHSHNVSTHRHTASGTYSVSRVSWSEISSTVSQFINAIWLRPMLRWCYEKKPKHQQPSKIGFSAWYVMCLSLQQTETTSQCFASSGTKKRGNFLCVHVFVQEKR